MSEPQPDLEPPQHELYMLFLLVLVFFLMGLVGFMICHVLKKKGYRCRTSRGSEPDDTQLQLPEEDDMNEDTVERIVRCIIQNEANAEALKEMLGDSEGEGTVQLSRFRVTHIEKRHGLHEHRDGSPTERSWGSGWGQDPGSSQGSGGGQPGAGMPARERLPPEGLQPQALASPPVQNGGLRDKSLVPCALEGNSGASAELALGAGKRSPGPGLPSQEENEQPTKLNASDHQVSPPWGAGVI
ncbi:RELT-like protein 2 isoform X2 [Choloepus didactylus]|uniref:RELT-like protein 2 isoform X2 n=1 Tax=Choloepus didactylus TaxID=27675 RepID=UPI0018A0CDD3|nr:RELT-like protein 2 isoform X2 [Choloepus didactylus]